MYLVALLPPPNIQKHFRAVQVKVFREYSNPAATALPPHIPLGFYDDAPEKLQSFIQAHPLRGGEYRTEGNCAYCSITPAAEIERIRAFLPDAEAAPLYPLVTGVSIGLDLSDRVNAKVLPILDVRWNSSHLCCYKLSFASGSRWWYNVGYEQTWNVKLKRAITNPRQ